MQTELKIEGSKIFTVLFLLFFLMLLSGSASAFIIYAAIYHIDWYYGFIALFPFYLLYLCSHYFIKVITNKHCYFKLNKESFSYLHIPKVIGSNKTILFSIIEVMYVKPKYNSVSFLYLKSFTKNDKAQLFMISDNNDQKIIPIKLSHEKVKEAVVSLNEWLINYKKLKS